MSLHVYFCAVFHVKIYLFYCCIWELFVSTSHFLPPTWRPPPGQSSGFCNRNPDMSELTACRALVRHGTIKVFILITSLILEGGHEHWAPNVLGNTSIGQMCISWRPGRQLVYPPPPPIYSRFGPPTKHPNPNPSTRPPPPP